MKNKLRKIFILGIFLVFSGAIFAQNVQPSVMVLPYTSTDGPSFIEEYEKHDYYRAVIAGVERAFQDRGFVPQSLKQAVLNARETEVMEARADITMRDRIISNSTAEITVNIELDFHNTGNHIEFSIAGINAVETSTGQALYSGEVLSTGEWPYNTNWLQVAGQVLELDGYIEKFCQGMQRAFTKMVEEGKPIKVIIVTDGSSDFSLEDEVGDDYETIRDKMQEWVSANAYRGIARFKGGTGNRAEWDLVRVPLRMDGQPYPLATWTKKLGIHLAKTCTAVGMGRATRPKEVTKMGTVTLTMPSLR